MDIIAKLFHGSRRGQVLGRGIHQVCKLVIAGQGRVDKGKANHQNHHNQNEDVDFLAEEHAENGLPIGIAGSRDALCFLVAMGLDGEQLLLAETQIVDFYFFLTHLDSPSFRVKGDSGVNRGHEHIAQHQ